MGEGRLPACFRRLPGAVLRLSPDGTVLESNGRLERELGRELVGRPFACVLDADSSGAKWARILADASAPPEDGSGGDDPGGVVRELVLRGRDTLPEPRAFSILPDEDGGEGGIWLLEHRADPRLDGLREQVTGVNSELASTQRDLVKERGRLAHALEETERLSALLREQNERLEERNEELLVVTGELRERGEELERSNRALDEFAHVVSHDLKAPLRSIANHAAWLEEDVGATLPGESREHLARIRDRAERMRTMIQGVLEYARAGREHARPERVDVAELLRETLALLDPPAGVEVRVEPGMPTLTTERAPLRQVFLNLVGNAVRHAGPDDPRVRVAAREAEGGHEFSVADDGPGIAPEARERIWSLFQTGDPREGTGIGLAVVKRLVEGRGGRVWVESEPGEGATFRFLWPAGRADAAAGGTDERHGATETMATTSEPAAGEAGR